MKERPFYIVDVFAEEKYAGNQLAVVRDASDLSDGEMLRIAKEMNYSETTFILSDEPKNGGFDVRIFTPDIELPFAGHPTLGTAYILRNKILKNDSDEILLNYRIGQIPVQFRSGEACGLWMTQKQPTFGKIYEVGPISQILGVGGQDIDDRFPVREVSTGAPAIIVPLKTLSAVKRLRLDYPKLFDLPKGPDTIGLLAFCPEAESAENHLHARFFTAMASIPEDPATGSANGCLAGYLVKHKVLGTESIDVRVEQGYEIGRPSLLFLKAGPVSDGIDVNVGGNVVMVAEGTLF
jgi:trans-2,3-dihydro-3-hydroxyanthranilate isomerase